MPVPKVLRDLLTLPTATFAEDAVLKYLCAACRPLRGVSCKCDRHGNLLACYRYRPPGTTPLVFVAHTDHPGFVAQEMRDKRTLRADFRGYVESPYFAGARVRFWSGGDWINGRVTDLTKTVAVNRMGRQTSRPEEVIIRVQQPVEVGAPGMWALPAPTARGDRLHALACDDLAGVGALLTLLQRLCRQRARAEVWCLFTRAEEVGFVGTVGAIKARTIPRKLPIFVVEMSKELPNARIGDGPIIRVGDRLSIYDPNLTAFCERIAQRLARRRKTFASQRRLMDGGACEATGFCAFGYRASGICLPLGNYHNMDTERGRIAPEFISLLDWRRMVDLFEALVLDKDGYGAADTATRDDLEKRFTNMQALLIPARCH
ncbi:MAG: hypothetical protein ABIG44_19370 [Planctomycetota bacterium]